MYVGLRSVKINFVAVAAYGPDPGGSSSSQMFLQFPGQRTLYILHREWSLNQSEKRISDESDAKY